MQTLLEVEVASWRQSGNVLDQTTSVVSLGSLALTTFKLTMSFIVP